MKSILLCSYASERSRPEKIERWIRDLVRYREAWSADPLKRETAEILLRKAESWPRGYARVR
jgi:hypothetical protein